MEPPRVADARVVDDRVDRAELLFGGVEEAVDGGRVGDVEAVGEGPAAGARNVARDLLEAVQAARAERDAEAELAQRARDGGADARRGARHHGVAALALRSASAAGCAHGLNSIDIEAKPRTFDEWMRTSRAGSIS